MAVSKDAQNNRVYTFDLYGDLKFSDGSAITAKDYAFSILLTASPELAKLGGQSAAAGAILGMESYQSGKSSVLRGVRLLSRHADVHHDQQGLRAVFLRDGAV